MKDYISKIPISFWSLLFIVVIASYFFYYLFFPKTIQETTNLDNSHSVKLIRHDGIDVNFRVVVDGEDVFFSPDFAPVKDDFRERLIWDGKGNVIVLEVAGKKLFGYNVQKKSKLSDEELLLIQYTPFHKYGYEGKLPEENK